MSIPIPSQSASTTNGGHLKVPTVELKFEAALDVIKNLPKNGSYKPTPQMMLKFYSHYKQATEGPCRKPKPWAWDVVNKAKWEAWSKLGDMPKEKAMEEYVENLKLVMTEAPPVSDDQIVEAMPATDNVQTFVKILGNFYQVVDLEPPDQFKKFSSDTTSTPLQNGSVTRLVDDSHRDEITDGSEPTDGSDSSSAEEFDQHHHGVENNNRRKEDCENESSDQQEDIESEDEFCDTAEEIHVSASAIQSYAMVGSDGTKLHSSPESSNGTCSFNQIENNASSSTVIIRSFGGEHGTRDAYRGTKPDQGQDMTEDDASGGQSSNELSPRTEMRSGGEGGKKNTPNSSSSERVQEQIAATLAQLKQDMNRVFNRLSLLEAVTAQHQSHRLSGGNGTFEGIWPFNELSPKTVLFILSWPFAAMWIMNIIHRRSLKR